MKKWMVLALAVGFVLTASLSAQADSILFPWVVKDKDISTVISLVNTYDPGSAKIRYHLIYEYKKTTANGQTEKCEEVDFCAPTSFNDVVVFDAAGNFNGGSPLFGDTTVKGTKYTTVQGTSFALPVDGPRRAFLIVDNEMYTTEQCGLGYETPDGTLYGEAMVVDIANGAAWGYAAYNPRREANVTSWRDFSDNESDSAGLIPSDSFGEVLNGDTMDGVADDVEFARVVFMPPKTFTTKMFVTPIANEEIADQWWGSYSVKVQLYCYPGFGGMFDLDENCISFDQVKDIVCTDASTLDHFVSSGAWIIFNNTAGPGWANLRVLTGSSLLGTPTDQATVGKLEYNIGTTTFDGNSVRGAINNFIWLRAHVR
ncbi:MAG: hypothetical protein WHS38_05930 [Thermodesulforhabdaceae bacterium]